ncbi:MAG: antibiotic biosynthesis monooxygenase [Myxococcales bacterium]|nr:antibiotic biosynthesis monooxygenase [Myxococcales bacterium]
MTPTHLLPHAFRRHDVTPTDADDVTARAVAVVRELAAAGVGCEDWAVHRSHDRLRVITIEAWRDEKAFRSAGARGELSGRQGDTALYRFAGPPALEPLALADEGKGIIAIDIFSVWRLVAGAVAAFNLRNGRAFHEQPGCFGTAVLRGRAAGRIATFARWESEEHFITAFQKVAGVPVDSLEAINAAAARMTRGFVRPDYHSFDRVERGGRA